MEQIYIGQDVPREFLIGEEVGTMQLYSQNEKSFGVSNEGKCVKPAILTRAVILNENFFAWEDNNGSRSIANKHGKDVALIAGYMHTVGPDYLISHARVACRSEETSVTTRLGIKMDGTLMPEMELMILERYNDNKHIRVDLTNDIDVYTGGDINLADSASISKEGPIR